jgi:predicted transcriptional regulator
MSELAVYVEKYESLEELTNLAKQEANAAEQSGMNAVMHAWQCGKYLCQIKQQLPHGEFGNWMKQNWEMEQAQAYRYMEVAMLNLSSARNLTLITDALKLAKQEAKPKIRQQVLNYVRENAGCTDDEIADAIEEKPASVRGSRSELCTEGLIRKIGSRATGKKPVSIYEAVPEGEIVSAKEDIEDAAVAMNFSDALRGATRCKSINADYLSEKTGMAKAKIQGWLELSGESSGYKAVRLDDCSYAVHRVRVKSDREVIKSVKSQSLHGEATPVESLSCDLAALSHKVEGILSLYSEGCKDFAVWNLLETDDRKNLRFLLSSAMAKVEKHFPLFLELIEE